MSSNYQQFLSLIAARYGRSFDSYESLHQFSITEQGAFWQAAVAFFDLQFSVAAEQLMVEGERLWQTQYFF